MLVSALAESKPLNLRSISGRGLFNGAARLDCDIKRWWFAFQRHASQIDIPLRVVWGYRTWLQQERLFKQGVGSPAGQSAHNFGFAVDVIHMARAWEDMPPEGWALLGAMGKEVARMQGLDLVWGGDFKSRYDPAHWEHKDWRKLSGSQCSCAGGCLPMWDIDSPAPF